MLPDTQGYCRRHPEIFEAQTRWLVESRASFNIKIVVHVGDLVDSGWLSSQWRHARRAMAILDGKVPYAVAPGNHDYGASFFSRNARNRTTRLHDYFEPKLFRAMPTFGGFYSGDGRVDNSYHQFEAGGENWLVLALEFAPRDAVVEWARNLILAHPKHRVIVATHAYLYTDNERYDRARFGRSQKWGPHNYGLAKFDANDGEGLWQKALAGHKNVLAVVCGHVLNDGVGYAVDEGVHQLLANYQMRAMGGNGFLRLLTFDTEKRCVAVRTYSPWLDQSDLGAEHNFDFEYGAL